MTKKKIKNVKKNKQVEEKEEKETIEEVKKSIQKLKDIGWINEKDPDKMMTKSEIKKRRDALCRFDCNDDHAFILYQLGMILDIHESMAPTQHVPTERKKKQCKIGIHDANSSPHDCCEYWCDYCGCTYDQFWKRKLPESKCPSCGRYGDYHLGMEKSPTQQEKVGIEIDLEELNKELWKIKDAENPVEEVRILLQEYTITDPLKQVPTEEKSKEALEYILHEAEINKINSEEYMEQASKDGKKEIHCPTCPDLIKCFPHMPNKCPKYDYPEDSPATESKPRIFHEDDCDIMNPCSFCDPQKSSKNDIIKKVEELFEMKKLNNKESTKWFEEFKDILEHLPDIEGE